jgi:hypothetical protein
MRSLSIRVGLVVSIVCAVLVGFAPKPAATNAQLTKDAILWSEPASDAHILSRSAGTTVCREATIEESLSLRFRSEPVRPIQGIRLAAADHLTILLRGTPQLDGFPQAKNAFINAAAKWESMIANPLTIIIDVDFGPNRFGNPFGPDVLGATTTQSLISNEPGLYRLIRDELMFGASNQAEEELYNLLPANQIPTEPNGLTDRMVATSANLRALDLLDPVATPEETLPGSPPSIGFNSTFDFDFDPSNGIDPNKIDFDAVAVHEIGHVLGFTSQVGVLEVFPNDPAGVAVTVWDLFRFRPGVGIGTFGTAPRVLASGGQHDFFGGSSTDLLSTGRFNGTGGDGFQAAHWKESRLTGNYIGVMDPEISDGERNEITDSDKLAIELFGYQLRVVTPGAPTITSAQARLVGDLLTITGNGADEENDVAQAVIRVVDGTGNILLQPPPFAANFGSNTFSFNFQVAGMNQLPSALRATVQLIDGASNASAQIVADFSLQEAGAPRINKINALPGDGVMVLKGVDLTGTMQLEVNGLIVSPPLRMKVKASGAKVKVPGSQTELNLHAGVNRVRLVRNSLFSNIFLLNQ